MQEQNFKRYLVTSALPYANGPLHIGHIAGAYLPADIYVRYLRLKKKDVVYVSGSDEHGAAITIQAKKEGVSPQEIVDKYHELNKQCFEQFGISFDIYHRTSSELHHKTSSEYFTALNDKGVFEVKESEQFYDEEAKQFLADRYITGTCPKCSNENAYGDQCENCGSTLSPTELMNPKSTLSGNEPILKKTKLWYLPLNKDEDWLKEWILEGKGQNEKWKKNVVGQCKSWLNEGLLPRAITRDLDWGVPVPVEGADGKVLYVWLDAPIGYISATKQWAIDNNKDWKPYWQDKETKLLHFIGKDNIVFHSIIFPVILKAHGDYILPTNVPANEFMNMEGDKMSTSRRWSVQLDLYLKEFPDKVDELRYVTAKNFPSTSDSEFTWKDYQEKINSELVGTLGNFVNRVLVLTNKYYDGVVPHFDPESFREDDTSIEWHENINEVVTKIANHLELYEFREALNQVMELARMGNKYLAETEPWKLVKEDEEAVKRIMNISIQLIANIAIVAEPYLPNTSKKLLSFLNLPESILDWSNAGRLDLVMTGSKVNKPTLLFAKIEDEMIEAQLAKLNAQKEKLDAQKTKFKPVKPEITFDDFQKMDIRTGIIIEAEKVPKADKLLQFKVDLGFESRTIVSGIAEHFEADNLIGQKVTVLVNLAPRKIRGVESQGMILLAENAEGDLTFVGSNDAGAGEEVN